MNDSLSWFGTAMDGATPLDPEDLVALRPSWVLTRADLNLVERDNIAKALVRRRWQRPRLGPLLDDMAIRDLHRDMFEDVWEWAGRYRSRELSIGVDPAQVATAVRLLVDDARVWLSEPSPAAIELAACRLHHRLVEIHPFPNGNGRLARAYTNLVLRAMGKSEFTWGSHAGAGAEAVRSAYLAALRAADRGDFSQLLTFVRT